MQSNFESANVELLNELNFYVSEQKNYKSFHAELKRNLEVEELKNKILDEKKVVLETQVSELLQTNNKMSNSIKELETKLKEKSASITGLTHQVEKINKAANLFKDESLLYKRKYEEEVDKSSSNIDRIRILEGEIELMKVKIKEEIENNQILYSNEKTLEKNISNLNQQNSIMRNKLENHLKKIIEKDEIISLLETKMKIYNAKKINEDAKDKRINELELELQMFAKKQLDIAEKEKRINFLEKQVSKNVAINFENPTTNIFQQIEEKNDIIKKLEIEVSSLQEIFDQIESKLIENSGTLYCVSGHKGSSKSNCQINGCLGLSNTNNKLLSHKRFVFFS